MQCCLADPGAPKTDTPEIGAALDQVQGTEMRTHYKTRFPCAVRHVSAALQTRERAIRNRQRPIRTGDHVDASSVGLALRSNVWNIT